MSTKTFTRKARLLSAAVSAAALLGSAGVATADTSTNLTLDCPFPLIGTQSLQSIVTTNIPATAEINKPTGSFNISAANQIPSDAAVGLGLVGAKTLEGSAAAKSRLVQSSGTLPLTVPLTIPSTPVPSSGAFEVVASGQTPSLTFTAQDTIDIFVDDITLDITARTADGSVAPAPVGEFTSDCAIQGGSTKLTSFDVVGGALEPVLEVGASSVSFGSVQAGTSSKKSVTVTNTGGGTLSISSVSISGAAASSFTESNNCTTLGAGQSCTVEVTFAPSSSGTASATLQVATSAGNKSIALSGTSALAPVANITVSGGLSFGEVAVGSSTQKTITVGNNGNAALSISSVSVSGAGFTETNNCTTVQPGATCAVNVTFAPGSEGAKSGQVTIRSSDPDQGTVTVAVSGSGKATSTGGGGNGGGADVPFLLDMTGSSTLWNGASLAINGSIDALLNLGTQKFVADLSIDPTTTMIPILGNFSRNWKSTATIEFVTTGPATGSLVNGKLMADAELYVRVPKVTIPLFGLNIKIGGGAECMTKEAVNISLQSKDGVDFNPLNGGMAYGVYDLSELENCGSLTGILSLYVKGKNNTLSVDLAPVL